MPLPVVEYFGAMRLMGCRYHAYCFAVDWRNTQVDYLDIFSVHGINTMQQLDWTLKEGGCLEVLEEYRAAGKIRWIGFSSHAHAPVIHAAISSNRFDCMNIHHHVRPKTTGNSCTVCLPVAPFCFGSSTLVHQGRMG